jgi:ADP-heptose:LPS heptosyltransferase
VEATLVVHEGPSYDDASRAILAGMRSPALPLVDPPLPALAGALSIASAYIGNDSGISHLAAAVGAPAVILFTEAALAWTPWSASAECLTVTTATVRDAEREAVSAALRALL